jgi:hypothetical protein
VSRTVVAHQPAGLVECTDTLHTRLAHPRFGETRKRAHSAPQGFRPLCISSVPRAPHRARRSASVAGPVSLELMLADFGSNVCPAGSVGIDTEVACESAVATLGLVYVNVSTRGDSGLPKGCYGNGTHSWLNPHATGRAAAGWQRICASCPDSVIVSGAESVASSGMGTYTKVAGLAQRGRPVYQRVYDSKGRQPSTVRFLFYQIILGKAGNWYIGSNYSSTTSFIKSASYNNLLVTSGPLCPDLGAGWEVLVSGIWKKYAITVAPTRPHLA